MIPQLLPLIAPDCASTTSDTTSEKLKRESKFGYRAPVAKPRLSPESRGFESPSTPLAILDWTDEVTPHYARIRSELERSGKLIGNMDLLIASHAVAQRMTVVTNSLKHFSNVPALNVELWK